MNENTMKVMCTKNKYRHGDQEFMVGKIYELTKKYDDWAPVNSFRTHKGKEVRLTGREVAFYFDIKNPVKEKVNGMNLEKMTVKELNELIENAKKEIARQDMTKLEKKVRELNRVLREVNELANELETILEETLENIGDDDFGYDGDNLCFLQTVKVNISQDRYGYENYVEFE